MSRDRRERRERRDQFLIFPEVCNNKDIEAFEIQVHKKNELLGSGGPYSEEDSCSNVMIPLLSKKVLTEEELEWTVVDNKNNKLSQEQIDKIIKQKPYIETSSYVLKI
jgi:hypothetical protein